MGMSVVAAVFFALDLYAWHRSIGYVGPGLATAVFYTGFLVSLRKLQSSVAQPSAALSLMTVSALSAVYLAIEMIRTGASFAIPTVQSGCSLVALALFSQIKFKAVSKHLR